MELYPAYERSHFLARMPAPERRFLADLAHEARFEDGEILFSAGEPAETFFVVGRGRVELVASDGSVVDTLGPGDVVGVSWLYPDRVWTLAARARGSFIGAAFPADDVRHRCTIDERMRLIVLEEMSSTLLDRLTRARGFFEA